MSRRTGIAIATAVVLLGGYYLLAGRQGTVPTSSEGAPEAGGQTADLGPADGRDLPGQDTGRVAVVSPNLRAGGSFAAGEELLVIDPSDFELAVEQAQDGKIAVLTFHGVPAVEHPWVDVSPEQFKTYMDCLRDNGCTVIALRDLAKYVDASESTGKSITYWP